MCISKSPFLLSSHKRGQDIGGISAFYHLPINKPTSARHTRFSIYKKMPLQRKETLHSKGMKGIYRGIKDRFYLSLIERHYLSYMDEMPLFEDVVFNPLYSKGIMKKINETLRKYLEEAFSLLFMFV